MKIRQMVYSKLKLKQKVNIKIAIFLWNILVYFWWHHDWWNI